MNRPDFPFWVYLAFLLAAGLASLAGVALGLILFDANWWT